MPLTRGPASRSIPPKLARELDELVGRGIRSISVLGGEPTLHVHTLLAIAAEASQPLPFALNSNMYMSPEVIDLLTGVARWYLADLKFGNDDCAERIAGAPEYGRVVRENLQHAAHSAGLIVRHVLLPGHRECCFRPLVTWLAETLPGARFQLYPGYVPMGSALRDPELGRLNTRQEVSAAIEILRASNLRWQTPPLERLALPAQPAAESGPASITIGADGQIYCHDLAAGLVPLLSVLGGRLNVDVASQTARPKESTP